MTYVVPLLYRAFYNYFYAILLMKQDFRTANVFPGIIWNYRSFQRVLYHFEDSCMIYWIHIVVEIHRNYYRKFLRRRQARYCLPRQRMPIVSICYPPCPMFARPVRIQTIFLVPCCFPLFICRIWNFEYYHSNLVSCIIDICLSQGLSVQNFRNGNDRSTQDSLFFWPSIRA